MFRRLYMRLTFVASVHLSHSESPENSMQGPCWSTKVLFFFLLFPHPACEAQQQRRDGSEQMIHFLFNVSSMEMCRFEEHADEERQKLEQEVAQLRVSSPLKPAPNISFQQGI